MKALVLSRIFNTCLLFLPRQHSVSLKKHNEQSQRSAASSRYPTQTSRALENPGTIPLIPKWTSFCS